MDPTNPRRVVSHKVPTINEKQLQNQITQVLRLLGYTIMETGKARGKTKCPKCNVYSYATGWQGNTAGLPDLYIHSINWPTALALAVELKTQTGTVRKEQKELNDKGLTTICRSLLCVLNAVLRIETLLHNDIAIEKIERMKEVNGY